MKGEESNQESRASAHDALSISEIRYRRLFEAARHGILILEVASLRITDANPFMTNLLGYSHADFLGKELWEIGFFTDKEASKAAFRELQENGYLRYDDLSLQTKLGESRQVEFVSKVYEEDGRHVIQCDIRDITEQKRLQAIQRGIEERYRTLFDQAPDGILIADSNSYYLDANASMCRMLGYSLNELIGLHAADIVAPAETQHIGEALPIIRAKSDYYREWKFSRKDGSQFAGEVMATMMPGGNLLAMVRDITERKLAEEKTKLIARLESKRERLDNVIATVPGLVWEAWGEPDAATQRINFVSDYVETMVGYSVHQWLSTPNFWLSIVHPDDKERVAKRAAASFASLSNCTMEFRWVANDGRIVWVESKFVVVADDEGRPAGLRGVNIDITERKKLEEQLRQAHKMEAIGTLAGGIAHDFNNILAVIIGYSELAQTGVPLGSKAADHLDQVLQASKRARDLVRQILTFSRQEEHEPVVVQVQTVISETLALLRMSLAGIEIRQNIDVTVPPVTGDPTQIQQMMVNLCVNAAQAMRDSGGVLEIGLKRLETDSHLASELLELKEGPLLCLTVSDNGLGMDAATQARAFEPFFTTKAPGEGTGLGLAVVHGLVKNHGGAITVDSKPGLGTTFTIYLPIHIGQGDAVVLESRDGPEGDSKDTLSVDHEAAMV